MAWSMLDLVYRYDQSTASHRGCKASFFGREGRFASFQLGSTLIGSILIDSTLLH